MTSSLMAYTSVTCHSGSAYFPRLQQPSSANMPHQKPVQDAKAPCVASCGNKETKTSRVRRPVRRETHLLNSLLWPGIGSFTSKCHAIAWFKDVFTI